ncbi:ATP-binding cassette domain-containing protein [Ornithinibacillus sp. L9]|uniref:ATP-binding cassette domain-containing protein n=1 Tax=Ornithinibacillus caprae TaxID=2678566 RepID=A0A6N8FHK6_9BACI|nr:ABC transporter ATP-binding protein [Ornithinibacillus caprae]MUK88711.1 ATP-binding cassette domain-containing protein [Ornithinibacillus caprae]
MQSLLNITHLQKKIDDFQLGPINLTIESGTITALVGNNGSGKSTLLKMIMNLVKPDQGNIKLLDQFVHGPGEDWKQSVAYQPQTIIGWDAFNGKQLKELISPLYPNWSEELFENMVHLFDIPLNKKFSKLSQGMQQKLNLALTIPRNAPLLILDEPTSFMDIPSKKLLIDVLVDWMDQGEHAILIASHQVEDIKKLSDYLFVLHDGEMIGNYEKEALTESYKRFWLKDTVLPSSKIPGEIVRYNQQLISNQPDVTQQFLQEQGIQWTDHSAVELEEIISLLLTPNI